MLIEDNKYINWHFKTSGRETHKSISYPGLKQITETKAKNNNNNNQKSTPQLGRCRRMAIIFGRVETAHKATIFRINMVIQRELIC